MRPLPSSSTIKTQQIRSKKIQDDTHTLCGNARWDEPQETAYWQRSLAECPSSASNLVTKAQPLAEETLGRTGASRRAPAPHPHTPFSQSLQTTRSRTRGRGARDTEMSLKTRFHESGAGDENLVVVFHFAILNLLALYVEQAYGRLCCVLSFCLEYS
jgi:hypothetical protein